MPPAVLRLRETPKRSSRVGGGTTGPPAIDSTDQQRVKLPSHETPKARLHEGRSYKHRLQKKLTCFQDVRVLLCHVTTSDSSSPLFPACPWILGVPLETAEHLGRLKRQQAKQPCVDVTTKDGL